MTQAHTNKSRDFFVSGMTQDFFISIGTAATASEAAVRYAGLGLYVIPLNGVHANGVCRCAKGIHCSSAGKHPIGRLCPKGWRDASRFEPTVARWWRLCPAANVGIVTGPSGLASLDVDPRNGGDQSLDQLLNEHGPLPETLHLRTGGGGSQYIFADPERIITKHTPLPGIDVLARASLFVAPPSNHRSGGRYRWANWGCQLSPVPSWMGKATP